MTNSFDFEMSERDYKSFVVRTYLRRGWAGAVGVLVLFLTLLALSGERDPIAFLAPAGAGLAAWAAIVFVVGHRASGIYRDTPSMRETRTVRFDAEGFEVVQKSGSFRSLWRDISRWTVDKHVLALWLNQAMIILIPIATATPHAIDGMAKHLRASGVAAGKRRKRA